MNGILINTKGRKLIMLSVLCLLQGFMSIMYSQSNTLSLSLNNVSVEQVINKIEQQTDYKFLYSKDLVDVNRKVSVSTSNQNIEEILDQLFKGTSIGYSVNNKQIVLSNKVDQNQKENSPKTVRGVVVDDQGQTVVGAYVLEKGTTNGTITDMDGKFELKLPASSSLQFTFVGFQTQIIPVGNNSSFKVTMVSDQKKLDEVIVVGYGTQKKATVTGSIAQLNGSDLKQSPAANLSNSLVGRMTGVIANNRSGEPGSDYSDIYIRGKGTLGNNSPLYVIDGVVSSGGIERLNSSDIESITVLKDASAAIYGAQAANGVILVTTKRGNSSKPTISYDGSFGLSQNTRTPHLMNAYQYMDYDDQINARYGRTENYKNIKGGYLDGTINPLQYANTDWMNVLFAPVAPQTQHSISLRGGSENVKYYVSGSYLYQKALYRNTPDHFNTIQMRANLDAKITNNLKTTFEFSERQENRNQSNYNVGTIFWETFCAYPFLTDYYPNGLPGPGISNGRNPALMVNGTTGFDNIKDNFYNTKVGFEYKIPWLTKGLLFSGYVAYQSHFRTEKKLSDMYDAYRYNVATNDYDNIRASTGDGNINLSQQFNEDATTTANLKLSYEKLFNNQSIRAFIAYEQSKQQGDWFSAYRQDFLSDKVPYLFAGGDFLKTNDGRATISARQNYFGRFNYAYKEKYLAEFTLRYDGSQIFAPQTRWGLFPGISVGWRISEEPFFQSHVKFVDELKLKASWGKLGNDRVNPFQYLSTYSLEDGAQFGVDPQQGKKLSPGVMANPNITWEKVDMKNIGFESQMWKGLLGVDLQYFYAFRSDILTPKQASVPDYTGITLPDENIGEISNSGVELALTHRNQLGQFKYYLGFNFTFARNKIHYFDEAADVPEWQKRTGYSMDSYLVYKTDGIYQTQAEIDNSPHLSGTKPGDIKYLDVDGSGTITSNDRVRIHESPIPEIVYGITMGGQYKGFELNILWAAQARAMQMVKPQTYNRDVSYYTDRWISADQTPNARYPRAFDKNDTYNVYDSDFWLKDASFIRLKNVEFAYNLSSRTLKRIGVDNFRIYINGSNLLCFDHIKIQDPESNSVGGLSYPLQRVYNLGVNLSF